MNEISKIASWLKREIKKRNMTENSCDIQVLHYKNTFVCIWNQGGYEECNIYSGEFGDKSLKVHGEPILLEEVSIKDSGDKKWKNYYFEWDGDTECNERLLNEIINGKPIHTIYEEFGIWEELGEKEAFKKVVNNNYMDSKQKACFKNYIDIEYSNDLPQCWAYKDRLKINGNRY